MLEAIRYLLLGILQGLTEPLPISSSGHLVLLQTFLNMPTVDYFLEIVLHFASLLAILVLFRDKITQLIIGTFRYFLKGDKSRVDDVRYVGLVLLGTVPAGIVGFFFQSFFEGFLTLLAVGISLIVTGGFLMLVQRASVDNTRTRIGLADALIIGSVQIIALLPGISRSGSTYVGGLFRRLKFEAVVEFSFMLYIPISIGTMILEARDITSFSAHPFLPLALSFLASGVVTYLAFKWFVNAVRQGNLKYFAYYCFVVGAIALALSPLF